MKQFLALLRLEISQWRVSLSMGLGASCVSCERCSYPPNTQPGPMEFRIRSTSFSS